MIHFYKTSGGYDAFLGTTGKDVRVGSIIISPAPTSGPAKGIVFKNLGGEVVAVYASLAAAQIGVRRMYEGVDEVTRETRTEGGRSPAAIKFKNK